MPCFFPFESIIRFTVRNTQMSFTPHSSKKRSDICRGRVVTYYQRGAAFNGTQVWELHPDPHDGNCSFPESCQRRQDRESILLDELVVIKAIHVLLRMQYLRLLKSDRPMARADRRSFNLRYILHSTLTGESPFTPPVKHDAFKKRQMLLYRNVCGRG